MEDLHKKRVDLLERIKQAKKLCRTRDTRRLEDEQREVTNRLMKAQLAAGHSDGK